jgi:hypothetical protein
MFQDPTRGVYHRFRMRSHDPSSTFVLKITRGYYVIAFRRGRFVAHVGRECLMAEIERDENRYGDPLGRGCKMLCEGYKNRGLSA